MIVVLGNTNDENGNLSAIAISRCDKAIELWNRDKNQQLITTGTFGSHFNSTTTSHSEYLKQYLVNNGITTHNILPNINSVNTYQDILGLRELLSKKKKQPVTIITSDFHYDRVRFNCNLILHDIINYEIIGVPAPVSSEVKAELLEYEKLRMAAIQKFPTTVYENASAEQKHYDNVSNWMITGELTTFALGYKFITDTFKTGVLFEWWQKLFFVLIVFLGVTLFWMLYIRAAQTARTARQTLRNIERCYSQFGFSLFYATGRLKNYFFTFKRILECIYLAITVLLVYQINAISAGILAACIILYLVVKYIIHIWKM
jgi:uncharacterized SAM-binding protein YcdF (DUF218 family)